MKMNKPDKSGQGNGELLAPSNKITDFKYDPNVQRRVAFATDLFQGDVTIRTLLESLAEGVVIIDNTATIVLVNRQTEKLFGYTKKEIVGHPLNVLLPDNFHGTHPEHVTGFFEKPKIRPMGLEKELAAPHKKGHNFPVEISLSHLETANGNLAMAFITDITLRKEAINNLQSRNEELDTFAHTVAHELRGSLATLIGYSELLNDHDVNLKEEETRESIDKIRRIGWKLSEVVDELLLLSSVRKEDVTVAPLDMLSLINDATFRLGHKIEECGAEITLAKEFPTALGYAPWVEEVWFNYISNAVKYGGTRPKIKLGGELLENGYARFWVKDNGPGLCQADKALLFVPYSSRGNDADSNGLGLSIVKRIVEKLNGYVGVTNEVNEGSIFDFTLPVVK